MILFVKSLCMTPINVPQWLYLAPFLTFDLGKCCDEVRFPRFPCRITQGYRKW